MGRPAVPGDAGPVRRRPIFPGRSKMAARVLGEKKQMKRKVRFVAIASAQRGAEGGFFRRQPEVAGFMQNGLFSPPRKLGGRRVAPWRLRGVMVALGVTLLLRQRSDVRALIFAAVHHLKHPQVARLRGKKNKKTRTAEARPAVFFNKTGSSIRCASFTRIDALHDK